MRVPSNGDLPEHRQKQVEAGLLQYQTILAERDELRSKLRDTAIQLEAQDVKLNALQGVINLMESTVQTCQIQRDAAVTKAARLSAIVDSIAVMIANEAYDEKQDGDGPDVSSD